MGPAQECDASGVQPAGGQQRDELGEHHGTGICAAGVAMPVVMTATINAGDRERCSVLVVGLSEERVQSELIPERAAVIRAASVQHAHRGVVPSYGAKRKR
jgi:hypothetical protein